MSQTVVGLFSSSSDAQRVVDELVAKGFKRNHIAVSANESVNTPTKSASTTESGGLMGLFNRLLGEGVPEQDAGYYAEGVRRKGTLVTVEADTNTAQRAADIMSQYGGIDIEQQGAQWKKSGWEGFNAKVASEPYTGEAILPVVEEQLNVGKREVERGGVRVYTRVTEKPVEEQVTLREEKVTVERRPVDRPVTAGDVNAFKEQSIELTQKSEEAVVSKTARVVEEVVVNKNATERTETVRDTVRRTDVEVEQVPDVQKTTGTTDVKTVGFDTYTADFRKYYDTNFAKSGLSYDQYEPVYRYGYDLGNNQQYSSKDWSSIEQDARKRWEERNPNTWEQFKDAVKYAWDKARNKA